jgi:transcriptional regulator with XRE-family HTH domain
MGNLYDTILALCESRGIKGAKLCTDVGISKGLLTDLKMGRRTGVSAVTAQKIAAYFDVSVGYLLGEEEKGEKKEQPTGFDGLSEKQKYLINKVMQMSDADLDKFDKILSLVENAE